MPKGFSEREKLLIRSQLQEKGKELFGSYGLKRTNVEDLTKAVGISKGAFYLFYPSKEELLFELLKQVEADVKQQILEGIRAGGAAPVERMKAVLHMALAARHNPLLSRLAGEDYEHLARKLPAELVEANRRNDTSAAADFIAAWAREGVAIACAPEQLAGLLQGLFFMSLHAGELGDAVYPDVIGVYIDLLAHYLVQAP